VPHACSSVAATWHELRCILVRLGLQRSASWGGGATDAHEGSGRHARRYSGGRVRWRVWARAPRSFLIGFSAVPPRNDTALVVPAINLWAHERDAREAGPHQLGCRVWACLRAV